MTPENLIPLYSFEAEMGVLGSMLLSERASEEITTYLEETDFYRPAHRMIYRAMRQLVNQSKMIDFITLKDELVARGNLADVGGEDYLIQIAQFVPSPANASYYAQIVQDKAQLRRLEETGREIAGLVHDPSLESAEDKVDRAEQLVFDVGKRAVGKHFRHIQSLAKEFFVDVDKVFDTGEAIHGLKTGFYDLDELTTGFYPGDFVIIGARPAMGKTSLVLDFAVNVAKKIADDGARGSVAFFSLEMSAIQLARRLASMVSGISGYTLKSGNMSEYAYRELAAGVELLYDLPIFIDDGSDVTPIEMRGKCRRLKAEHGLSLVVIDYLQLMRGSKRTENRVQEISEIARACKSMAKELEIPVIALSQLNRGVENRDDKRPQLADIRESGSIEAEADMVMLLYRDSYYKAKEEHKQESINPDDVQEAEIIVAKHRNGPTGKVLLGFQPSYARYRNLEKGTYRGGSID